MFVLPKPGDVYMASPENRSTLTFSLADAIDEEPAQILAGLWHVVNISEKYSRPGKRVVKSHIVTVITPSGLFTLCITFPTGNEDNTWFCKIFKKI